MFWSWCLWRRALWARADLFWEKCKNNKKICGHKQLKTLNLREKMNNIGSFHCKIRYTTNPKNVNFNTWRPFLIASESVPNCCPCAWCKFTIDWVEYALQNSWLLLCFPVCWIWLLYTCYRHRKRMLLNWIFAFIQMMQNIRFNLIKVE